jgi:hypothetical protein
MQNHSSLSIAVILTCFILLSVGFLSNSIPRSNAASNSVLVVPSDYPTIQAAINAAKPGDTVKVLPGTYTEQLIIDKSITLLGSGEASTFINEPTTIVPDSLGYFWGVHVANNAKVTISGFTFSTPPNPFSTCTVNNAPFCATIFVEGGASLYLSSSKVDFSYLSNGLWIGLGSPSPGQAFVNGVDFEIPPTTTNTVSFGGIIVTGGSYLQLSNSKIALIPTVGGGSLGIFLDTGSTASILHNSIIGSVPIESNPGISADISFNTIEPTGQSPFGKCGCATTAMTIGYSSKVEVTYNKIIGGLNVFNGIVVYASADALNPTIASISHNTISNFLCTNIEGSPAGYCGPNSFTQDQSIGILVDPEISACFPCGSYPQTTINAIAITDNHIDKTDIGIALGGVQNCCVVSNNVILKSTDYAISGADGSYTFSNTKIVGGLYAVSAISGFGAFFGTGSANTIVTMDGSTVQGISIAPTYLQPTVPYTVKVVFTK